MECETSSSIGELFMCLLHCRPSSSPPQRFSWLGWFSAALFILILFVCQTVNGDNISHFQYKYIPHPLSSVSVLSAFDCTPLPVRQTFILDRPTIGESPWRTAWNAIRTRLGLGQGKHDESPCIQGDSSYLKYISLDLLTSSDWPSFSIAINPLGQSFVHRPQSTSYQYVRTASSH